MGVHFVYPAIPFMLGTVDETFEAEADAIREAGFAVSSISVEELEQDNFKIRPIIPADSTVVYRGWMLNANTYASLERGVQQRDAKMLTTAGTYLHCHHLPNWYSSLEGFTPETKFFPLDANLEHELEQLGWESYFLKDHVKSLKTGMGSIIREPAQATAWLEEMIRTRGTLEGGICVRRVEALRPETERRSFVIQGQAFAPDGPVPDLVLEVAKRISSPFFSVDLITREDGMQRVIEIGDGQVSDLVGWEPQTFAQAWLATHAV
jgi:ATP-grasp domain, R2K clade family 3